MPSAADKQMVVAAFDAAYYPGHEEVSLDTAWLGIYQTLCWYEHGALHIREANDLRKPIWARRASRVEHHIAESLGVQPEVVPTLVDRMMQLPRWHGMQRNNPLGAGLRMLVSEVLARFGNPQFSYPEEADATLWFPGISMPGRSKTPKVDVSAVRKTNGLPKVLLSCKWSIRHDRVSDPTNEATQYKAAAIQRQLMDLRYFVVTNELDTQRLDKILNQPAVDGLVHINLPSVLTISSMSPEMTHAAATGRLFDLADFVRASYAWA